MRLLLARHGEIDAKGRYFGSTDLPLTSKGEKQAEELAGKIALLKPNICLCSPMLRTRQTSKFISEATDCETIYIDQLREINFGIWERMTFDEIEGNYPQQAAKWAASPLDFTFPEGDNTKLFFRRIREFAKDLPQRQEETLLLVTHGGVIRALICHFLGLEFDKHLLFNVQPAGLVTLDVFEELGVLSGLNI